MQTDSGPKILIVDDEERMCRSLQILLSREGRYDVSYCLTGDEALEFLEAGSVDLMITDLSMPEMGGMELLRRVKAKDPDLNVVIMTAYSSVKSAIEAMKEGAFEYLIKPFGNEEFLGVVDRAVQMCSSKAESSKKGSEDKGKWRIIGKSGRMIDVLNTIEKASVTDSNVLILGESGTGKELVAREVHERGRRSKGPFVAINCAALPETLLESELFGFEKGAFTGAVRTQIGRFERANGGTIFLDEISEMSPALQTKILRFIQEREFERVGGNAPIGVDVRIIAATNRDVRDAVSNKGFRDDLYYRLSVITIELPPLRERKEDIPLLVEHFLEKKGGAMGKRLESLSDEAWKMLFNYNYPGNVRELENIIERALVIAEGDVIDSNDLQIFGPKVHAPSSEDELVIDGLWKIFRLFMGIEEWRLQDSWLLKDELLQSIKLELESRLIKSAISEYPDISNSELANLLGTTRRILELRMKEFGIDKDTPEVK